MEQSEYGKKGQVLHESYIWVQYSMVYRKTQLEKAVEEQENLWEPNDHVSVLKIQHWRSMKYLSSL